MNNFIIRKGSVVEILPEFQDKGDEKYTWYAVDDEEKGRVSISPDGAELPFPPVQTVRVEWLKLVIQ